jgi:hypothetical protein
VRFAVGRERIALHVLDGVDQRRQGKGDVVGARLPGQREIAHGAQHRRQVLQQHLGRGVLLADAVGVGLRDQFGSRGPVYRVRLWLWLWLWFCVRPRLWVGAIRGMIFHYRSAFM